MSTNPKHTPGPWKITHKHPDPDTAKGYMEIMQSNGSGFEIGISCSICEQYLADDPIQKANAHLIAAAPDILEALKQLVKINEDHDDSIAKILGAPPGWKDEYLDKARSAIAKAEGRVG